MRTLRFRYEMQKMIDMRNIFLLVFFIIFTLSSCDYAYEYTYEVTNKSDSEIRVDLKTFRIDLTYLIEINETKILFITEHGVEGSKGPYFDDVSVDLDEFVVTKNDTLISDKNYLDNSSWDYNDGLYKSTVYNEEFE